MGDFFKKSVTFSEYLKFTMSAKPLVIPIRILLQVVKNMFFLVAIQFLNVRLQKL